MPCVPKDVIEEEDRRVAHSAKWALRYLGPIMDHAAHSGLSRPCAEALWRTAGILRQRMIVGGLPDPWPVPAVPGGTCMLFTQKGERCQLLRKEDEVACRIHQSANGSVATTAWRAAVHYPLRRRWSWVTDNRSDDELARLMRPWFTWTPMNFDYDLSEAGISAGLREMIAELSR